MDVTPHIQAKSDQLNADDLMSGPVVVQIQGVSRGDADQPVVIKVSGHRPWKPCKTMLRLLVFAWGADASVWVGRRVELYRDPKVKWGGVEVGGIRVSALSHIDRALSVALTATRGRKSMVQVQRLEEPKPVELDDVLAEHGLTRVEVDAWLVSKGQPPLSERDQSKQQQLAGWLAASPARIQAVREASNA